MQLAIPPLAAEDSDSTALTTATTTPSDFDGSAVGIAVIWLMFYFIIFAFSIVY